MFNISIEYVYITRKCISATQQLSKYIKEQ